MKTLTICEHDYVVIADQSLDANLTISEVEVLDEAQKKMGANAFSWVGRRQIKASQFVGIIATSHIRLEILPKIQKSEKNQTRGVLIKMICAALTIPIYDGEITPLNAQDKDLLEILILVFARRLVREVRKGLTRNYHRQNDDLSRLRGKMNVIRQFTKFAAMPQILACEFDEFSADNPLNRLLACTTSFLIHKTNVEGTKRLLAEINAHFTEIRPVTVEHALRENIRIDLKNQRWRVSARLSRLLLQSFYQTAHGGKYEGVALLFDMNKLFEAYVTRVAQKTLRPMGYKVLAQKPERALVRSYDGQEAFITKPDIYVKGQGQTIIIDTKWKLLDLTKRNYGISQADAYQMHGYARVYDADTTILLYPSMSDQRGELTSWIFENSEARLRLATIYILNETEMGITLKSLVSEQNGYLSKGTYSKHPDFVNPTYIQS